MRCRSSPGPGRYRTRAGCDRPPEGERVNLPGGVAPAVVLRGLVKRFGATLAVAGLDLDIPAGSFYGVVGPNGAGKTTTLSMATGLLVPDAGTVHVHGVRHQQPGGHRQGGRLACAVGADDAVERPGGDV